MFIQIYIYIYNYLIIYMFQFTHTYIYIYLFFDNRHLCLYIYLHMHILHIYLCISYCIISMQYLPIAHDIYINIYTYFQIFQAIHMSISTFRTVHSITMPLQHAQPSVNREKPGSAIPGFLNLGMAQYYVAYCAPYMVEYLIRKAPVIPSRFCRFSMRNQ